MDASVVYGRLSNEATLLEQAAQQTRAASASQRAHNNPELAARYDNLASAYDARAKDLRQRAERSGYLGAVPSAGRANRRQFKMAIDRESLALGKNEASLARVRERKKNAQGETLAALEGEERHLVIAIEDRQLRIAGMHAAVATVENAQGQTDLGPSVSGSRGVVQRVRDLLDGVRGTQPNSVPNAEAQGALNAFLSTLHPGAARNALLSEAYLRGTDPQKRATGGPIAQGVPSAVHEARAGLEAPGIAADAARTHAKAIDDWLRAPPPAEPLPGGQTPPRTYREGVPPQVGEALTALQQPGLSADAQRQHAATVGAWMRQGVPADVVAAVTALGNPNISTAAARAHGATIDAHLRADQPGYANHVERSTRRHMERHVDQRAGWDQASAQQLPAERAFWGNNPSLSGPPLKEVGRLRGTMKQLFSRSTARTPGPRLGADHGDNAIVAPLDRFTFGGKDANGNRIDMLDDKARAAHLSNLTANARTWSEGRRDPVFDWATGVGVTYGNLTQQATNTMRDKMAELAQDPGAEISGFMDEDREAFYGALNAERADTLSLVQQLRALLKV